MCDSPLTKNGIQQAKEAQIILQDVKFNHCYSSIAERCCDTLELVTSLPYQRLKGLKERYFGLFEGESEDLNPPFDKYDEFFPVYGGETKDQVGERILSTLTAIMNKDDHQCVLAVSHAGACCCFIGIIGEEKLLHTKKFSNCCILHFSYDDNGFHFIEMLND